MSKILKPNGGTSNGSEGNIPDDIPEEVAEKIQKQAEYVEEEVKEFVDSFDLDLEELEENNNYKLVFDWSPENVTVYLYEKVEAKDIPKKEFDEE